MPHKPKILVDLAKLKDIYTGLGQVSLQFSKALLQQNNGDFDITFLLPKGTENYFSGADVQFEFTGLKRRYFPELCKKYDLWHAIHTDSAYMPGSKNALYLLTVHDLNFMQEKSAAKAKKRLFRLQKKIDRANAVTYISQFAKQQAQKYLAIPKAPQQVIYNGVENLIGQPQHKPAFLPVGEFFFSIGVIVAKKNFHVLVDMMEQMPGFNLVIAGNNSSAYAKKLEQTIAEKGLQQRIIMPGKISAEEKNYLYSHCKAFLFPSLYEGFGLPVIEAMQFGKPVFLSTSSSLPEVGGTHAFYWQNFDAQQMKNTVLDGLKHFYEHPYMADEEQKHAQKFSWQQNASEYLALYKKLLA